MAAEPGRIAKGMEEKGRGGSVWLYCSVGIYPLKYPAPGGAGSVVTINELFPSTLNVYG